MARGMIPTPRFGSAFSSRSPLSGITHYAEKPIRQPAIKVPKVGAPRVAAPKGPAVTQPKFAAAGGLGQPGFGKAGPIASNRPPSTKQVSPRITPMRRDLIPASRPIGMTSQDAGSGGLQ
jgi:hypothetical protein